MLEGLTSSALIDKLRQEMVNVFVQSFYKEFYL